VGELVDAGGARQRRGDLGDRGGALQGGQPALGHVPGLGDVDGGAEDAHRLPARVGHHPAAGDGPADRAIGAQHAGLDGVLTVALHGHPHRVPDRSVVVGVDVAHEQPVRRGQLDGAVQAEDRGTPVVPEDRPRAQVLLPDADRTGLEGHLQPGEGRADRRLRGGQLQLGDDGGRQLLQQLGGVVRPVPRDRVVDRQHPDDVAGGGDQGGTQVGRHLPGGDGRQLGHALVLRGRREAQRSPEPHRDRRERAGQEGGATDDPGRQAVTADDDVVVGEEGDLGVGGAHQAGRQPGEPVERRRPGHLQQQPPGGPDPVRVDQGIGVSGARESQRGHAPSLARRFGRQRRNGAIVPRPPPPTRYRPGSASH
jgi:hypothetical protein